MEFTVILATLNEEENIVRFLDSLFSQSRLPDEVILVDGFSDDRTVELAKDYDVDIYLDDKDLASARNIGVRHADSDIVVFTDVDGYLDKDWLKEIERGFEENKDIVGLQGKSIVVSSNALKKEADFQNAGKDVKFTHGANMAFRKEVVEEVGFFDSNQNCGWEDMDLGYRISDEGRIIYWPYAIQYEFHRDNNFRVCVRNGRYWIRFVKKYNNPIWLLRPAYYVLLYTVNGEIKKAVEEFFGMTYGACREILSL